MATVNEMLEEQARLARKSYEGTGGWNDGRWGQAYDLVYAALKDAGHDMRYKHPILHLLEMEGAGCL